MSLIPLVQCSKFNNTWQSEPLLKIIMNNMKLPKTRNSILYYTKYKLLGNKYGKLKGVVKLQIQIVTFVKTINKYLKTIDRLHTKSKKIELLLILFRYLEQSGDLLVQYLDFQNRIIYKLLELKECAIDIADVFLYTLHYKCDSVLECCHMCIKDTHLSFNQCRNHLKLKLKYELHLIQILSKTIPEPIIDIINRYIHERSY